MHISLIVNFMSILMQFLTILKTNSWADAIFASIYNTLPNHTFD